MRRGIGRLRAGGSGFNPATLFPAGEQGIWYDPGTISTLYQDSAGTTPVTEVGDPVGLMIDRRLGFTRPGQQANSDTGYDGTWTNQAGCNVSGGVATYTAASPPNSSFRSSAITLVGGRSYDIVYTIDSISAGGIAAYVGGTTSSNVRTTPGTYTERLTTTAADQFIALRASGSATTCQLSFFSVIEYTGNHASQSTAASRPILRQSAGLYYLEFDGLDDWLSISAGSDLTVSQSTIGLAGKIAAVGGYQIGMSLVNQIIYANINTTNKWGGNNGTDLASSYAATSKLVMIERTRAANDVDLFTNNNAVETKATGVAYSTRANYIAGTGAVQFAQMDFYGAVATTSVISDSSLAGLKGYLNSRIVAY